MRRLTLVALTLLVAGCTVDEPTVTIPGGPPPARPTPVDPAAQELSPPPLLANDRPKESADELVTQGLGAEQSEDFPAASRLFDRALQVDPKHRKALLLGARLEGVLGEQSPAPHNARHYLIAAKQMRALRAAYPDLDASEKQTLASALFNEACAYAITGETARVVPALSEAHAAGFDDLAHLDLDPDLDPFRSDPAFKAVLDKMERERAARVLESTKPFPFDFKLPDPNGKVVSMAEYKGKVLIVDFWGTWCPPCRKELPHLIRLAKTREKDGLAVVGLTYEHAIGETARDVVRNFVRSVEIPYPCLMGDQETMKQVPDFSGFPQTLVIDREGKVRANVTGYQPLGALEALVAPLLAAKAAPKP